MSNGVDPKEWFPGREDELHESEFNGIRGMTKPLGSSSANLCGTTTTTRAQTQRVPVHSAAFPASTGILAPVLF